jgi:hypothetical protein
MSEELSGYWHCPILLSQLPIFVPSHRLSAETRLGITEKTPAKKTARAKIVTAEKNMVLFFLNKFFCAMIIFRKT